jgi:hypothetical protein
MNEEHDIILFFNDEIAINHHDSLALVKAR